MDEEGIFGHIQAYRRWKQGPVSLEKYRPIAQTVRNQARKVKALIELYLARDIKANTKASIGKPVLKERLGLLHKETGDVVTWDMEKAGVLTGFFALVFTRKCSSHTIQVAEAWMENSSHCRRSSLRPSKEPAAA